MRMCVKTFDMGISSVYNLFLFHAKFDAETFLTVNFTKAYSTQTIPISFALPSAFLVLYYIT